MLLRDFVQRYPFFVISVPIRLSCYQFLTPTLPRLTLKFFPKINIRTKIVCSCQNLFITLYSVLYDNKNNHYQIKRKLWTKNYSKH